MTILNVVSGVFNVELRSFRIEKNYDQNEIPMDIKRLLSASTAVLVFHHRRPSILTMSKSSTPSNSNTLLLRRQLTELTKHPVEGFSAGPCTQVLSFWHES